MKDRENSSIQVKRMVGSEEVILLTTLITPSSMRRFKLMETNEVTLNFSLARAIPIEVGDYIDDEVFGRFYAKEPQVCVYNKVTGGYDYSLRFVSHEMMWSNYKFLMSNIKTDGTYGRKETSWKLTASLQGHLTQVRQNLVALGLYNDVIICMSDTIEKREESKFIAYDGDDIHSGLKKICDAFECEWWTSFVAQGLQVEYFTVNDEGHVGDYFRTPLYDRQISEGVGEWKKAINLMAYQNKSKDIIYISKKDGLTNFNSLYYIYEDNERMVIRKRTDSVALPIPKTYTATGGTKTSLTFPSTTKYEYKNENGEFLYSDKVLTPESKYYTYSQGSFKTYNVVNPMLVSKTDNIRNIDANATLCLFVGKCENWEGVELSTLEGSTSVWHPSEDEALDFIEGDNVESMSIAKDQSEYANRIYVFGGTQNVPSSYRKNLLLRVDRTQTLSKGDLTINLFEDSNHFIRSSMVSSSSKVPLQSVAFSHGEIEDSSSPKMPTVEYTKSFTLNRTFDVKLAYDLNVHFHIKLLRTDNNEEASPTFMQYNGALRLYITKNGDSSFGEFELYNNRKVQFSNNYYGSIDRYFRFTGERETRLTNGTYTVHFCLKEPDDLGIENTYYTINNTQYRGGYAFSKYDEERHQKEFYMKMVDFGCDTDINYVSVLYDTYESYLLNIKYNGNPYLVMFNPEEKGEMTRESKMFAFVDRNSDGTPKKVGGEVVYITPPSGFGVGSVFEPLVKDATTFEGYPYGMNVIDVPFGWYVGDYDNPFSLLTLGENRLLLPLGGYPNGYMGEEMQPHALVEKVVCFDKIYPRCVLVVTNVTPLGKKMKTEYEDGSIVKTSYSEYHIEVECIGGEEFPFKESYQSQGTLKMNFVNMSVLTESEKASMPQNAKVSKLGGMEFECNFGKSIYGNDGFLLIMNDTYGAYLPNETLQPEIGDICVLTNWDVRAMLHLGLIGNAENQLAQKGDEYRRALQENRYTFTCQMMSGEMLRRAFYESLGRRMIEGEHIYLKGDGSNYYLPLEGQKVRIKSEALKEGEKVSRVLGYEFKLDIPYDTPTYTIGETDAYSRLKKIEKEITKLS